ncbi:MAG: hypothetical protein WCR13_05900 [Sphaerochaeta sp.]
MKYRMFVCLLIILVCTPLSALEAGNTTLSGVNGYLVLPSAEPVSSGKSSTVTTGYSGIFSSSQFAHIPFIQIGFSNTYEIAVALDIAQETDVLLNTKWRFSHKGDTSLSVGLVGQLIDVSNEKDLAAQLYFASTFTSSIMNYPSKTTVLVGYTFDESLTSDIDFGLAFQTPFLPDVFKKTVDFLLDFGNVSYSISPSGGDAKTRGLVNIGLRLLPVEFLNSVYLSAELRALDLFDHQGRAISAGVAISFRPNP